MTSCQLLRQGRFIRNRLDTTRPTALNKLSRSLSSSCCAIAAPASANPEINLRGICASPWQRRRAGRRSGFPPVKLLAFHGLSILLVDDFHNGSDLLGRDPPPLPFRPSSHDLEFEVVVQPDGAIIVTQCIGKQRKGQMSRSASAIPPAKAGWGMIEQVEPQRQCLTFLTVADGHDGLPQTGLALRYAVAGHRFSSIATGAGPHRAALRSGHGALRYGQQGSRLSSPEVCGACQKQSGPA